MLGVFFAKDLFGKGGTVVKHLPTGKMVANFRVQEIDYFARVN